MDHEKKSPHSNKFSPDQSRNQSKDESPRDQSKETPGFTAAAAYPSAIDEFFASLQSGQYRPKPAETVAASVQALRRMTGVANAETAASAVVSAPAVVESVSAVRTCVACGTQNLKQSSFCGACGVPLIDPPPGEAELPPAQVATAPAIQSSAATQPQSQPQHTQGLHYYHHHYHHHYFGEEASPGSAPGLHSENASAREGSRARAPLGGALSQGESAVPKFSQAWILACNTRQLDDLVNLYAADALVMRPNAQTVRGTAAIREFFSEALEAGLGEVEFEPLRVEVLGDVAYEAGRCKMLVPGTPGKRREEKGKYLMILRRQVGGEWKAVADSWASDLSLAVSAEPNVARPGMQNSATFLRPPRKSA